MDSFEINKIMGAILGTLLFVMGVGFLAEAIYHPIEDRGPGYALPEPEPIAAADAGPAVVETPLGILLASANVENGAKAVKKCQSCHNFGAGEPNKTGPLLYDVVDRLIGSHEGFAYSAGMEEHKAKGDLWTYENLNKFITSPKTFTPGTKMTFAGIKSPEERADVLAYLQTLSAAPKPFPAAEEAPVTAPVTENAEPAATEAPAVETPTTTQSETSVQGTTTGSETPAGATEAPAPTAAPATPAPTAPAAPAPTAPAATPAPAAPVAPAAAPVTN